MLVWNLNIVDMILWVVGRMIVTKIQTNVFKLIEQSSNGYHHLLSIIYALITSLFSLSIIRHIIQLPNKPLQGLHVRKTLYQSCYTSLGVVFI